MSAYGCMECGFNTRDGDIFEAHDQERPASCRLWTALVQRIESQRRRIALIPAILGKEPFASLDRELEAYWQKIEPLYVREEA